MLSLSGYDVELRSTSEDAHRRELAALGFDSVPVVRIGARAFPGFPERQLLGELGLRDGPASPEEVRNELARTLADLQRAAEVLGTLPDRAWEHQMRPETDRDHPLGHFAWAIFRFLELVADARTRRELLWEDLEPSVDRRSWPESIRRHSFAEIAEYGARTMERARALLASLDDDSLRAPVRTPWGPMPFERLLGILADHTALKTSILADTATSVTSGASTRSVRDGW